MAKSTALPLGNIDHVAIVVENLRRTVQFYEKYFGFKIEREFGNRALGVRAVVLKRKGSRLELFEYRNDKPEYAKRRAEVHGAKVSRQYFEPGIRHIAFRTRKFKGAVSGLRAMGLDPWIKPKKGYSGDSITFVQDPNGILLEIVSPVPNRGRARAAGKKK